MKNQYHRRATALALGLSLCALRAGLHTPIAAAAAGRFSLAVDEAGSGGHPRAGDSAAAEQRMNADAREGNGT
jgi:hypothetical protein